MQRWSSDLSRTIAEGRVKTGPISRSCCFHIPCLDHSASSPVGYSYLKAALWEAYISLDENTEKNLLPCTIDCNWNTVSTRQLLFKSGHKQLNVYAVWRQKRKHFWQHLVWLRLFLLHTNAHKSSFSAKQCVVSLSHTHIVFPVIRSPWCGLLLGRERGMAAICTYFPKYVLFFYLEIPSEETGGLRTCGWHFWTSRFPALMHRSML